jgi:guanylate kinase
VNAFPIILSSPSGGGKTTIARRVLRSREDVGYSVSATTRAPRPGEAHGKDYYFLTPDAFREAKARGEFAESAEVHGRMYGTLRSEVERVLSEGKHVLMDIDVQGARQFAQAFPESVLVFVLPPSAEVLMNRLRDRKTESRDALLERLRNARDELGAVAGYHYVVVNDDLDRAVEQVSAIIDAESVRHERVHDLGEQIGRLIHQIEHEINGYSQT